jgi:hypothetical protein
LIQKGHGHGEMIQKGRGARTLKDPTSLLISVPSSTAAWYVKNFTMKAVSPAKLIWNCDLVSGVAVAEHRKILRPKLYKVFGVDLALTAQVPAPVYKHHSSLS